MNGYGPIWRFVLSALAVWRLTHLFAEEDGPWDLVARVRGALGNGFWGRLMDCFYCLSLWFSLPISIWLASGWMGIFLHWQALSGAACLLEKATNREKGETRFGEMAAASIAALEIDGDRGDAPCVVVKREAR